MNGIDRFAFHPSGIIIFDGCLGASISSKWAAKTEVGTLITISAGNIVFAHAGGADAGLSILPFGHNFGVQTSFEADVQVATGEGENNLNSGIRLYANVDNWIQLGPYISGVTDSAMALTYSVDGVAGTAVLLTNEVDDLVRRIRLTVLENHVIAYVNGIRMYDLEFTDTERDMVDYAFQLVTGTSDTTDILNVKFTNIKISNKVEDPEPYPARFKGIVTLADTTPATITLLGAENGDAYELIFSADLGQGYTPYAFTLDSPSTYTDITNKCNSLVSGNITLLPAAPANGDAVFIGADAKFWCIDVYMDGGVSNSDNTFAIQYWNGSSWTAISGATDGTTGGTSGLTFYQNGRIYFAPPANWAAVAVNGVTAYWVKIVVTTYGVSVPAATHIQVGFDSTSYFDQHAAFLSSLMISMKRNFPVAGYARAYNDAMPYLQCLGERNIDINGWRCDGDVQISFTLSETPAKTISVEYMGFTRRI